MGSPVSQVVANIYMEMFEGMAVNTALVRPRIWKRNMDDIFCIMKEEHINSLLDHLNRQRPTIKFTMEKEENRSLPFMDI